jgi:hypothetical protein
VAKKSILHANQLSPGAIQRKKYEKVEFHITVKNRQTLLLFVGSGAIFITPIVYGPNLVFLPLQCRRCLKRLNISKNFLKNLRIMSCPMLRSTLFLELRQR